MLSKRLLLILIPLLASFNLPGCQPEDKITREKRPRLNDMKRLLAAIVLPQGDRQAQKTWFFKVVGLESEIEPAVESFNDFVRSIRFADPDHPTWTLPHGWTDDKDKKLRYATIYVGPKGKAPELTVTALQGVKAASVPENVVRWRIQLGLKITRADGSPLLGAGDLEDFYRYEHAGDLTVLVVDMIGPGGGNMPPMEEPAPTEPPFKFEVPLGWKEIPPTDKLYVLSFVTVDKDKKAAINVSVFPGAGGGLLLNVNRWRGQVNLGALTAEQVNALPDVAVGDAKGKLVDIKGPDAPPQRNRILGAILIRATDSRFFKMMGPSDVVDQQQQAFETFLKSIKFDD